MTFVEATVDTWLLDVIVAIVLIMSFALQAVAQLVPNEVAEGPDLCPFSRPSLSFLSSMQCWPGDRF